MPPGTKPLPSARARELILAGDAPTDMAVSGHLNLSGRTDLRRLPDGLAALSLDLTGCTTLERLPHNLKVSLLRLDGCSQLTELPAHLSCQCLEFRQGPIVTLPPALRIAHKLALDGCAALAELPEGLCVQTLSVQGCLSLAALPATLDVQELNIADCAGLSYWPGPTALRLHRLNVANCPRLRALPDGLTIDGPLEIAQSAINRLPPSLATVRLHWRGVLVSERVAFYPETLTAEEVLTEPNLEVRRIMVERVGYDRLFDETKAEVLDSDRDPGGERILRHITLPRDEPLTCLSVRCPSTGRPYTLRVPPEVRTCRQAAAWLAGFDNPDDYQPIVET